MAEDDNEEDVEVRCRLYLGVRLANVSFQVPFVMMRIRK